MFNETIQRHPADAIERRLPDADAARALLLARRPELLEWLSRWHATLPADVSPAFGRALADVLTIGLARMGLRHGSWSSDFHAYHNENHALELLDGRLARLLATGQPDLRARLSLALFCVCHDLRQRETGEADAPVGANEAASLAETFRLLDHAGLSREGARWLYLDLALAIAGSTFDARPLPDASRGNSAELAAHGGPLAPRLSTWLDTIAPGWRGDAELRHAAMTARMASDLDTANVAETLPALAASAIRLCEEREMRAGRDLDDPAGAAACLAFLGEGQSRYFFQLHRFCSPAGEAAFAAGKTANAAPLRALVQALQDEYPAGPAPGQRGRDVIGDFTRLALRVNG